MSRSPPDLSVLSLFTGAGGLDLGLEAAGFEPVLCVEIDSESRETLKRNRPVWLLSDPGDIHQLKPAQLLQQAGLKPRQLTLLAGEQLLGDHVRRILRLLPERAAECPRPERVSRVPRAYLNLRAEHREHPGTGLGPAARRRRTESRA